MTGAPFCPPGREVPGLSRHIGLTLRNGGAAKALEFEGCWHSWADLAVLADSVTTLLEQHCPGEVRIGLIARNRPSVLAVLLGLVANGFTVVMIHAAQSDERLAAEIESLDLAAVAAEARFWQDRVKAAASAAGTVQIVLGDDIDEPPLAIMPEAIRSAGPAQSGVALELLSSGTTGRPKRIAILWRTLELALGTAHGTAMFDANVQALAGQDLPPAISGLSLGNIGGIYMMLPSALIGQSIVMLDRFAVEPWVRAVRTYRPEVLSVQPAGLRMILEAGVPRADLSSLRTIVSGASHLDPELQDEFEERYGMRVFGAYGATETCGSIIVWTDELYDRFRSEKRGSVGKPVDGVEVRIVDRNTGATLPAGKIGLLHARVDRVGPHWIETTDLARIDADGFVYIEGRADNAIDRGGFSVPPDMVADALRRHPAVRDAGVVGIADERLGEVPVAAVELVAGADAPTEEELIAFARERLLSYQVPVRIVCVAELPRNASLKVIAPEVRKLFVSEQS